MKLHCAGLRRGAWNKFENDQKEFCKVFIYFILIP